MFTYFHFQEAQVYAQENGLFFMETSAKAATNVNDIFYEIGMTVFTCVNVPFQSVMVHLVLYLLIKI